MARGSGPACARADRRDTAGRARDGRNRVGAAVDGAVDEQPYEHEGQDCPDHMARIGGRLTSRVRDGPLGPAHLRFHPRFMIPRSLKQAKRSRRNRRCAGQGGRRAPVKSTTANPRHRVGHPGPRVRRAAHLRAINSRTNPIPTVAGSTGSIPCDQLEHTQVHYHAAIQIALRHGASDPGGIGSRAVRPAVVLLLAARPQLQPGRSSTSSRRQIVCSRSVTSSSVDACRLTTTAARILDSTTCRRCGRLGQSMSIYIDLGDGKARSSSRRSQHHRAQEPRDHHIEITRRPSRLRPRSTEVGREQRPLGLQQGPGRPVVLEASLGAGPCCPLSDLQMVSAAALRRRAVVSRFPATARASGPMRGLSRCLLITIRSRRGSSGLLVLTSSASASAS